MRRNANKVTGSERVSRGLSKHTIPETACSDRTQRLKFSQNDYYLLKIPIGNIQIQI
jgi:hypothetical protein